MSKTSFHFKPCNIAASEAHNKRSKELDYIREDLSHLNESFFYTDKSLQSELSALKKEVKKKTGRALQKNANPIQEGVLVIEEGTSMEQVKQFCDAVAARWNIRPLQIHIHKDEGHMKSKTWKPNYHAHVVFSVYNSEGRNARIQKSDCREMQTMAADILGMERGKSSSKKHLDSLMFKIEQLEKHNEKLEQQNEELKHRIAAFEGVKEGVTDLFIGKTRKAKKKAEKKAETERERADNAEKEKSELKKKLETAERKHETAEKKYDDLKKTSENAQKTLSDEVSRLKEYRTLYKKSESHRRNLIEERDGIVKNIGHVLPEAQKYGLSTEDAISLCTRMHTEVKKIVVNGESFTSKSGFLLKWVDCIKVRIGALLQKDNEKDLHWLQVEEWAKRMKDYLGTKKTLGNKRGLTM